LALFNFIVKRVITSIGLLFAIVVTNFVIFRVAHPDPAVLLGQAQLLPAQYEEIRISFGLDKPLWEQFILYIKNVFTGNWGISFYTRRPVIVEIGDRLINTVTLVTPSVFISATVGLLLGIWVAAKQRFRSSMTITSTGIILYALPVFWLGILFLMFFARI
jgi:peptide/nickel transport system permease protein